jgi:hypothetical protein
MNARKPPAADYNWPSSLPEPPGHASLERHFSVGELDQARPFAVWSPAPRASPF